MPPHAQYAPAQFVDGMTLGAMPPMPMYSPAPQQMSPMPVAAPPHAPFPVAPPVSRVPSAIEIFNAVKQRIAADDEGTTEEEQDEEA
jgi:hypothetical protein